LENAAKFKYWRVTSTNKNDIQDIINADENLKIPDTIIVLSVSVFPSF
jgi:hypothetical protein